MRTKDYISIQKSGNILKKFRVKHLLILSICILPLLLTSCALREPKTNITGLESYYSSYEQKLGHLLFFDKKLSGGQNISCSTCHNPQIAFTDGYRKSFNAYADPLSTNSPSLLNLHTRKYFHWSDSSVNSLEKQLLKPLFSDDPVEMAFFRREREILTYINSHYTALIKNILPPKEVFTTEDLISALKSYILDLKSYNSPYDKYVSSKDSSFLTNQAFEGMKLFFSDRLGCVYCHGGINFHQPVAPEKNYTVNEYKSCDTSLKKITYRIPSLRNVAITHPYYHNGSTHSLYDVLRNYERGNINNCGKEIPEILEEQLQYLRIFSLQETERKLIISFLYALTDTSYLKDPYFVDPELMEN